MAVKTCTRMHARATAFSVYPKLEYQLPKKIGTYNDPPSSVYLWTCDPLPELPSETWEKAFVYK